MKEQKQEIIDKQQQVITENQEAKNEQKKQKKQKESLYYRFMKGIAKTFIFRKAKVVFEEDPGDEPAIFLCNHSQANGPAFMTIYFNKPHKTWIISYALQKNNVNYIFHDFLIGRARKFKPFWRFVAKVVSVFLRPLLLSSNPIPVYHSMKITETFKQTLEALKSGENIVIFPECPTKYSEYVNDIYSGFVDIGKTYYAETGKILKFYPVYVEKKNRLISVGKPISYDITVSPRAQRDAVGEYIRNGIDALARNVPEHKPVPFLTELWYETYGEYAEDPREYWKVCENK